MNIQTHTSNPGFFFSFIHLYPQSLEEHKWIVLVYAFILKKEQHCSRNSVCKMLEKGETVSEKCWAPTPKTRHSSRPPIWFTNRMSWSEPNVEPWANSFRFPPGSSFPFSSFVSNVSPSLAAAWLMLAIPLPHILPGAGGIMLAIPPDIPVLGPNRI